MMLSSAPGRTSAIPPLSRYAFHDLKNKKQNNRPQTCETFPTRKSRNPFFIRNAPHPSKVKHIKGLLDIPVCTVNDTQYNLPPPSRQNNIEQWRNLPVLKRERFVPGIGLINTQSEWVEELQNFTRKVGLKTNQLVSISPFNEKMLSPRERIASRLSSRTSVKNGSRKGVSFEDGIPPPSRQISTNGSSRRSVRNNKAENDFVRKQFNNCLQNKSSDLYGGEMANALKQDVAGKEIVVDDKESYVFHLLTRILKTDSYNDIKHWLLQATAKEKDTVLDMVRAISNIGDVNNDKGDTSVQVLRPDYETNFLYHESSLDPEVYNQQQGQQGNSARKTPPKNAMLEQIHESVEIDIDEHTRTKSAPSIDQQLVGNFLPRISQGDVEIEEIRSRLMSRSSLNVFGGTRT